MYDYEAATEDEISIVEDEPLNIIYKLDEDWWVTEKNGQYGQCPASYVGEEGAEDEVSLIYKIYNLYYKISKYKYLKFCYFQGWSRWTSRWSCWSGRTNQ